jgi:ribosomal protein L3
VIEAIEALEQEFGVTVMAASQACVWDALRLVGVDDAIQGYGRAGACARFCARQSPSHHGVPSRRALTSVGRLNRISARRVVARYQLNMRKKCCKKQKEWTT